MQKFQENVTDQFGRVVSEALISVSVSGGGIATLYSDNGITTTANPFRADTLGFYSFHAANGTYDIAISGTGITSYAHTDQILYDPADGSAALAATSGAGLVGFLYSVTYAASTVGKWLQDLALSTGAGFIGWIQAGTGAVLRTIQSKLRAKVSIEDFGGVADGATTATDNLAALYRGLVYLDSTGGGVLHCEGQAYSFSDEIEWGDGSNSQQSTKYHRISLRGRGIGTGAEVSNAQAAGATRFIYNGATDTTKAVLNFLGPLHSVSLENIVLDANSKAGLPWIVNHCTQSFFKRVIGINYSTAALKLTSRNAFPSGCAFGNADNIFEQCYGYSPTNNTADGVILTSGVSTASSLIGAPDSARNKFIGGTFFYGGSTGSAGARLAGADNNTMDGTIFLPKGGNDGGGKSVQFDQWAGSTAFPLENLFINISGSQAIGGTSGTSGNTFLPLSTSDGIAQPAITDIHSLNHLGLQFTGGLRAYRGRQIIEAHSTTSQASSGMVATFGSITAGSLYTNGSYTKVPLTVSSGTAGQGATANITVSGAAVTACTLVNPGIGYDATSILSAAAANIGGTGSGFSIPVATVTTTSFTNVPGYSVSIVTLANSYLKVEFCGSANKATAGSGYYEIAINGTAYAETMSRIYALGSYGSVAATKLIAVNAGTQVITVQFASSDTNATTLLNGTLTVQELV